eukprot:5086577-Alexandrium_andersonii.AAC.1
MTHFSSPVEYLSAAAELPHAGHANVLFGLAQDRSVWSRMARRVREYPSPDLPVFRPGYSEAMRAASREPSYLDPPNPRRYLTGEEIGAWYEACAGLTWQVFDRASPWVDGWLGER